MSEHMFGVGKGRIKVSMADQIDRIAKRHGATFTWANIPGNGWQYWFVGPNRGDPFNGDMARAVRADLVAAGLADENGLTDACKLAKG